jgi:hypothetical protein
MRKQLSYKSGKTILNTDKKGEISAKNIQKKKGKSEF